MKKIITMLLVLVVIVSMTACGGNSSVDSSEEDTGPQNGTESENVPESSDISDGALEEAAGEEASDPGQNSNVLVAYFSRVGNTEWEEGVDAVTSASINVENGEFAGNAELLAQMVQETAGGDLFLIQTEEPYPSDYRETTDVAAEEQETDARPALSSHVENMDSYDTIVLVYPNWWGTLPQPLFTFLEEYDFSGKTILPLCTHGGSRMGSSEGDISRLCPDAVLLEGLAVSGSDAASAQPEVEEWINNSGILG